MRRAPDKEMRTSRLNAQASQIDQALDERVERIDIFPTNSRVPRVHRLSIQRGCDINTPQPLRRGAAAQADVFAGAYCRNSGALLHLAGPGIGCLVGALS